MMFVFGTVLAAPLHLATEAVSPPTLSRLGAPPADVLPLDLGPQVGDFPPFVNRISGRRVPAPV